MVKLVEGLEDRIGPVDCALFASCTVPNVARYLRFPDVKLHVHLPDSWRCIETCKVLGLQPLLDNCGSMSLSQYIHRSSHRRRSFSSRVNFLILEASICIGSGIDVLVMLDFVGIATFARYGSEIDRHSCRLSKSRLSHRTACVMAFDKEVGSSRFRSKSLISSRSLHRNALLSALSSQLTLQASCRNSIAYTEAARDRCWSDRNLVVAVRARSVSPKVLVNSARNASRSVNSGVFFSNNGEN